MKDLYVVIGTDGSSNWLCYDGFEEDVFGSEAEAVELAELLKDSGSDYSYKPAKLTFLD